MIKYVNFKILISRLFYNDGLITIFGWEVICVETLDFTFGEVMILGIILNIAAGVGSFVFGFLEDKIGVKNCKISLLCFNMQLLLLISPETNFLRDFFVWCFNWV